ncbi:MAG: response regulator [Prevotella sp.]|nr:response regulator [Prevotella sp.]
MKNRDSLTLLRLKMLGGYASLIVVFIIASCLIVTGNRKLEENNHRYSENIERRNLSEQTFLLLFDLTQLDGQVAVWNDSLMDEYETKEQMVLGMMDSLAAQVPDTAQARRVREIRSLVGEKKNYLLAIHTDLDGLRDVNGLMKQRMPEIIRQANRANEQLTDKVSENLQENRHKTAGWRGIFKSKKKADEVTDAENRQALNRAKHQTDEILTTLVSDIERSQERSAGQLFAHMDTLVGRNHQLNEKISRLVADFNNEDSQMRRFGSTHLMQHQQQTVHMIMWFGVAAFLLAMFFFWLLHRDIKLRQKNKQKLEESNQHNKELLALRHNMMLSVSHDLRAPLTTITGYADMIADADSESKRQQYGAIVKQSADHMLELLNTLLNYYRLDTGKDEAETVPFRIKDVLNAILAEFSPLATAKHISIEGRFCGDESAVVMGDHKRIMQIVGNLASNAIKFTERGTVDLSMEHKNGRLTIEVKDTGSGMSEEQMQRIFTPFNRLENADTKEGFGLGLSITQALVELLDGDLHVESMMGIGSRFTVMLPIMESSEELLQQTITETAILPDGLRIAIVDDDAMVLKMTVEMLKRKGVKAEACHTVDELLDCLRKRPYDLIITDIMLGNMSGFDLLELLRLANIGNSKAVPLLAMTGRTERSREDFIKAGFSGSLTKPFSSAELTQTIADIVGDNEPVEDKTPTVDFSMLLKGEKNPKEMLALLISQTELEANEIKEAMETGNVEKIAFLLHRLESRWELLGIERPLRKLRKALDEGGDVTDGVSDLLAMSEQLIIQTRMKMEGGVA